jgi:hypothetical protein
MRLFDRLDNFNPVARTVTSLDSVTGDSTGNWDPFAGIGGSPNGSGGILDGLSSILNTAGGVFGSIWKTVNTPNQQILPGGGVLVNGQPYYPSAVGAGGGSLLLLGMFGLVAFLLLRK